MQIITYNAFRSKTHPIIQTEMKKYLYLLLKILLVSSCTTSSVETININPTNTYKSNKHAIIKQIIQLETNDSSLIGEINNIETFADKIYLLDKHYSKAVYIFDTAGRFIRKTILGKGPGEYLAPRSFTIDKKNKELVVWDMNQSSFVISDLELNFKRKIRSPYLIRDFVFTGKDTILATSFDFYAKNKNLLTEYAIFTNSFQNKIATFLPVERELEKDWYNKVISHKGDNTYFIGYWDYNIYSLNNQQASPAYCIDFGDYQITKENQALSYSQKWEKVKKGQITGSLSDLCITKKYISFSAVFKSKRRVYFYDKKHESLFDLQTFTERKELPVLRLGNTTNNNYFIGIVTPEDFRTFVLPDKITPDTSTKNPVIILFKITS